MYEKRCREYECGILFSWKLIMYGYIYGTKRPGRKSGKRPGSIREDLLKPSNPISDF